MDNPRDKLSEEADKASSKVTVIINGVQGEVDSGVTLLEAAHQIGAGLSHLCFGNALCSTCRVNVPAGAKGLSPKGIKEKVSLNYHLCFDEEVRLACQARVLGPAPIVAQAPKPFDRFRPKDKKTAHKASEAELALALNPPAPKTA